MELVGVEFMDFKGNDGDRVSGVKFHCLDEEVAAGKGLGQKVFSIFCSNDKCPKVPPIGSHLDFVFNRWGRLVRFDVLD